MTRNRVLLVDDDPEIRFSIRHYLELHGMHVTEADSVQSRASRNSSLAPPTPQSSTLPCLMAAASSYWNTSRVPMQMFPSSCWRHKARSNWPFGRSKKAQSNF